MACRNEERGGDQALFRVEQHPADHCAAGYRKLIWIRRDYSPCADYGCDGVDIMLNCPEI